MVHTAPHSDVVNMTLLIHEGCHAETLAMGRPQSSCQNVNKPQPLMGLLKIDKCQGPLSPDIDDCTCLSISFLIMTKRYLPTMVPRQMVRAFPATVLVRFHRVISLFTLQLAPHSQYSWYMSKALDYRSLDHGFGSGLVWDARCHSSFKLRRLVGPI